MTKVVYSYTCTLKVVFQNNFESIHEGLELGRINDLSTL